MEISPLEDPGSNLATTGWSEGMGNNFLSSATGNGGEGGKAMEMQEGCLQSPSLAISSLVFLHVILLVFLATHLALKQI